jgi:diguanylate cyclase
MLFYSQFIFTLALYFVVEDFGKVFEFAFYHSLISIIGGYITLHFLEYIRKNTELYRQYKEFSQKDYLTGLNNARGFDILFNQAIADIKQRKSTCCLCMIDIDYFKKINDTHGHQAGDEILKQFATILTNSAHSSYIVSRNGGEEFSILIPDCDNVMGAEIAESVRQEVENHPFKLADGKTIHISVSIGLSYLMNEEMHPDALIGQADDALYKAKHAGRNLVVQYNG